MQAISKLSKNSEGTVYLEEKTDLKKKITNFTTNSDEKDV
jgi:hypothetical protein